MRASSAATERLFMTTKAAFLRSGLAQPAIEAIPAPISLALRPGTVIYFYHGSSHGLQPPRSRGFLAHDHTLRLAATPLIGSSPDYLGSAPIYFAL